MTTGEALGESNPSPPGHDDLNRLEHVIGNDLKAFIRVGVALAQIKLRRLYLLAGFHNFETYCRRRWGIGRQYGYRLMTAADIAQELSPIGDGLLVSEGQVRPLACLPSKRQRRTAFALACSWSEGKPPTANLVRTAAQEIQSRKKLVRRSQSKTAGEMTILRGDSRDRRLLPAGGIDVILGSPPYNVGIAYSNWNDLLTPDDYLEVLRQWLAACFFWANPQHGRLLLIVAMDTHKGRPFPLAAHAVRFALQAGWNYRATIIWNEPSTKSWPTLSKRATAPDYHCAAEAVLIFHRGSWERPAPERIDVTPGEYSEWSRGVWAIKSHAISRAGQPAIFPPELVDRLLRQFSFRGDTVLDPWAGTFDQLETTSFLLSEFRK